MARRLAVAVIPAAAAVAQSPNDVVIHLWVDPTYGSDAPAPTVNNPSAGANKCLPTDLTPPDVLDASGVKVLQHAPWPFKTVTAAVNYVTAVTGGGLPYTSPTTGAVWAFAIIHCLPGRYSRDTSADPHNGLAGNGETFPIDLPNRVSVQGTSALNTVFDLYDPSEPDPNLRGIGPAFRFGTDAAHRGEHSFVSTVTIAGGRAANNASGFQYEAAAIYLSEQVPGVPTIANCFLVFNGAGVLIDEGSGQQPTIHEPTLANNTIAFHSVGVWAGDPDVVPPATTTSSSRVLAINNVFDNGQPHDLLKFSGGGGGAREPLVIQGSLIAGTLAASSSGFEGLDVGDLTVSGTGDFNAYGTGSFNRGVSFSNLALPATASATHASPTTPGFDIAPFMGLSGTGVYRGALYVRDLMHVCDDSVAGGPYQHSVTHPHFDLSPGDFRLAPATCSNWGPALTLSNVSPPSAINLLVDAGIDALPITMVNGRTLTDPPGTLPMGNSAWPHHLWEFDCEGFGNPRIVFHLGLYAPGVAPVNGHVIDIGADELDVHVLAGYRFGTTRFAEWDDGSTHFMQNRFGWLLGPPQGLAGRPAGGVPLPYESLDASVVAASSWGTGAYYNPTRADVTPHLLPDVHPHWSLLGGAPSNPEWRKCISSHNSTLYDLPTVGAINPPGSHSTWVFPGSTWLDGLPWSPGVQNWHADPVRGGPTGGPTIQYFDSWCQNKNTAGGGGLVDDQYAMMNHVGVNETYWFSTDYLVVAGVPFGMANGNLQSYAGFHR